MGAFQDKMTKHIKTFSAERNIEADFEYNWSNICKIYFRIGFRTLGTMNIDFQSNYMSGMFTTGEKAVEMIVGARQDGKFFVEYDKNSVVANFLSQLESYISFLSVSNNTVPMKKTRKKKTA